MRRVSIVTGLILLLPLVSTAQDFGVLGLVADCAKITDPKARLQCYDAMAKGLSEMAGKSGVTVPGGGKWVVDSHKNPLDDSQEVVLFLEADTGRSSWGLPIYLVVRCAGNAVDVYINWNSYLDGSPTVTWRVGAGSMQRRPWGGSADHKSTFYPLETAEFLGELEASEKFVAQLTPYQENPITAEFDLRGLKGAAVPLMEACGLN